MIEIVDKSKCCGCEACRSICPKKCISMQADKEGFLYPKVDLSQCVDCKLCEKVCPVLNPKYSKKEPLVYAGINNDINIRLQSSSGGIFTLIAEQIILKKGVVFGACFDEQWNVVHDYTETKEGLARFRGSKYVQSYIGNSFLQAKRFLDEGRFVLFSGTPCQIAGLRNFLRKPYQNLLTVDLVCHGVPSQKVWKKYLYELVSEAYNIKKRSLSFSFADKINSISFRSKENGWKKYNVKIEYKNGKKDVIPAERNIYMNAFLSDLSLRPSCYDCPAKLHKVQSDITLADFWGVDRLHPEIDDDKGCGLILVNKEHAFALLKSLDCQLYEQKLDEVIPFNPSIEHPVKEPVNRNFFYMVLDKNNLAFAYNASTSSAILMRIIRKIYRRL